MRFVGDGDGSAPGELPLLNGRYRLLQEVGRGGMATIWEAQDETLERRVAIKLLHAQFARDAEFLERFRREARSAAGLAHPNIVGVYDVAQDMEAGSPFLVLELVDGHSLKDVLRTRGALPESETRAIGAAIADALEYAHRRGVVHRDVKPQNILVSAADGRPRLTDFGIAQAVTQSGLTRTGAVMGSVHYLAPELARGRQATPAVDVYGLGIVLYEMATGRLPFTGETDMAIALAHVEQPAPRPRATNPRLSTALEATILRALRKDPAERFGSAGELAAALRAPASVQATTVVPVASAGTPPRAQTTVVAAPRRAVARRQRHSSGGWLAMLLVFAAILIALGVGLFGLASFSRDGALTSTRPTPVVPTPTVVEAPPTATRVPAVSAPTLIPTSPPAPSPTLVPTAAPPTATPRPAATATPQRIAVPGVVGRRVDEAQAVLRAAGFTSAVQRVNVNAERDSVVAQSPVSGTAVAPGSSITLSVATGQVEVPDVTGKQEQEAIRLLSAAGLRVDETSRRSDNRIPAGSLIRTDPEAGKVVPRGSQVDLVISTGAR